MAEKNTQSILETIKKKMLKLDRKAENIVEEATEEEFQYLSSSNKVDSLESEKANIAKSVEPEFEDDLGLDLEANSNELVDKKSDAKNMTSFDDFNLDDLDLDEEEKIGSEKPQQRDPDFENEDLEDFENEIDLEVDKNEAKNVEESDDLDLENLGDDEDESENQNNVEPDDLDLENLDDDEDLEEKSEEPEGEKANSDELDLENLDDEELVEDEDSSAHEDKQESEELDLDILEIDEDEEESLEKLPESDDLDLENLGEDEDEFENQNNAESDDLDLENLDLDDDLEEKSDESEGEKENSDELDLEDDLEDELFEEENSENVSTQTELENLDEDKTESDDLGLEDLDLDETDHEQEGEKSPNLQGQDLEEDEDDFNFDDLDQDDLGEDFAKSAKEEENDFKQELPSFSESLEAEPKIANPKEELESFSKKGESSLEKHEIDLEFEKDIMGFKAGASENIKTQPLVQNYPNVSEQFTQSQQTEIAEPKEFNSTIRQVSDSMRKLIDAKNVVSGISSFSQSPALSELAIHIMEPKLEKWFNENLPELVEKVVREEIKKMIPKD